MAAATRRFALLCCVLSMALGLVSCGSGEIAPKLPDGTVSPAPGQSANEAPGTPEAVSATNPDGALADPEGVAEGATPTTTIQPAMPDAGDPNPAAPTEPAGSGTKPQASPAGGDTAVSSDPPATATDKQDRPPVPNSSPPVAVPVKDRLALAAVPSLGTVASNPAQGALPINLPIADTTLNTVSRRLNLVGESINPDVPYLHNYSRRQVWNADESRLIIQDSLVDASTFAVIEENLPFSSEWNWSNVDRAIVYAMQFNERRPIVFGSYNIDRREFNPIHTFHEFEACRIGSGEGKLTNDDRYIVFSCHRNGVVAELLSFDITHRKVIGRTAADPTFNWVSATPLGRYILVENNDPVTDKRRLERYSMWFQDRTLLTTDVEHGDFGVASNGQEYFVMIDYERIYAVPLNGSAVVRTPYSAFTSNPGFGHVSCLNRKRPGWCYFSAHEGNWIGSINIDMLLEIDRDPELAATAPLFELWDYHNSTASYYQALPKPSVSPSGEQIIYSTDFHGTAPVSDVILTRRYR